MFPVLLVLLVASGITAGIPLPAHAATVVVTDCSAGGGQVVVVGSTTRIANAAGNDVIVRCGLEELAGTDGIRIEAHSIHVDGPGGGSIQSSGTAGIVLQAGMNDNGTDCEVAGDFGASIEIEGAKLEDGNANGGIKLDACGDISVDVVGGSQLSSTGGTIRATCYEDAVNPHTGQPCQILSDHASWSGNRILVEAEGDVTLICSEFQTIGPRDLQRVISHQGSVLAGSLAIEPPDPRCICPELCSNRFRGGIESNLDIEADDNIDLDHACIEIAENIDILAHGTDGPALDGGVIIDLSFSEIRDDFGKTGFITITAHPIAPLTLPGGGVQTGDGAIDIEQILLVEYGKQGGGTDPQKVATLNGGDQVLAGVQCMAIDPDSSCVGRGISLDDNLSSADPAERALRNVQHANAVRCDT